VIKELRQKLEQKKGQMQKLISIIDDLKADEIKYLKDIDDSEKAQVIIQQVAQDTQKELEYHISELCSLALASVFDNPYELKLEFVIRRGKTEADIYFERDGEKYEPMRSTGGGSIDVACFGLRVALWSLSKPKARNVLILDEPFQHLKGDEPNRRAVQMVKEVSKNLGLQIIMVSDERVKQETIVDGADKVFMVKQKNKISKVETL